MRFVTESSEETQALGSRLAKVIKPGDVFALEGGLGSGKTELVRGVVDALNPEAIVRSPSFALVNSYDTPVFPVHHFDFYRIHDSGELWEIGYDEYLNPDAVCFIEWAHLCKESLPKNIHTIRFVEAHDDHRVIESDMEIPA